jgi:hypothetical protein
LEFKTQGFARVKRINMLHYEGKSSVLIVSELQATVVESVLNGAPRHVVAAHIHVLLTAKSIQLAFWLSILRESLGYAKDRTLGGTQSRFGSCAKKNGMYPYQNRSPLCLPFIFRRVSKIAQSNYYFVVSVCPSVCPHGKTRVLLTGWIFVKFDI